MVYENINRLCSSKGITIKQVETDLGFGNGTIGKWKRSNPGCEKLKLIAEYFGITMEELMQKPAKN